MPIYRHALYFAPEDSSALAQAGWQWLGRQPDSETLQTLPDVGLDKDWQADLVREARGYGFHATLKAPFRLACEDGAGALIRELAAFAKQQRPFIQPPLILTDLHGFLALRPATPSDALSGLAGNAVTLFDQYRAPLNAAEMARRLRSPLSPSQREKLERWGYPYVLDEFRFHMTLTRRITELERSQLFPILRDHFAAALAEPVRVLSICFYQQASPDAPFILARRFPFGG